MCSWFALTSLIHSRCHCSPPSDGAEREFICRDNFPGSRFAVAGLISITPSAHLSGLHLDAAFSQWHFAAVIETLEIERMTFTERVQAMELLWRSMSAEPGKLTSPAWHKTVLQKRLAKVEAGKGGFLTVAQLKKRLAKRAA